MTKQTKGRVYTARDYPELAAAFKNAYKSYPWYKRLWWKLFPPKFKIPDHRGQFLKTNDTVK